MFDCFDENSFVPRCLSFAVMGSIQELLMKISRKVEFSELNRFLKLRFSTRYVLCSLFIVWKKCSFLGGHAFYPDITLSLGGGGAPARAPNFKFQHTAPPCKGDDLVTHAYDSDQTLSVGRVRRCLKIFGFYVNCFPLGGEIWRNDSKFWQISLFFSHYL